MALRQGKDRVGGKSERSGNECKLHQSDREPAHAVSESAQADGEPRLLTAEVPIPHDGTSQHQGKLHEVQQSHERAFRCGFPAVHVNCVRRRKARDHGDAERKSCVAYAGEAREHEDRQVDGHDHREQRRGKLPCVAGAARGRDRAGPRRSGSTAVTTTE